jgi:Xaa-Pro aminopeptidase
MHEAVVSAQRNAIDSYRPGKSTGDELCQAAWEALRESGFGEGITHFLGHGLGFAYHEDRPILGPGESVIIKPGHVTSVEPGIYWRVGDEFIGGIRVEDNVVWGEKAGQVEVLSDFFRGLSIP